MTARRELLRDPALASVAIVAWSVLSPWALGFSDSKAALAFHVPFAMAFLPLSALGAGLGAARLLTAAGGLLLAAAPFAFGFSGAGTAAWLGDLVSGLALAGVATAGLRTRA